MHPWIGDACALPEGGVDAKLLVALQTTLSLDVLLDIREIVTVSNSWRVARQRNIDSKPRP